ncbi:MAG: hypothetical protein D6738_13890, partial [Acidobacteria bacterium]
MNGAGRTRGGCGARPGRDGAVRGLRAAVALVCALAGAVAARAGSDPGLVVESSGARVGPVVDETVTALLQDHHGLLWIGTRGGLMLYDGHELRTFRHEVGNPASLSDNTIRTIHEDRNGRLWLGTNTAGLELVDAARWTFTHHAPRAGDPHSLSHESVNAILDDRNGNLWVATQIGLNRCSADMSRCERIFAGAEGDEGLPHDYVYALAEDGDGTVWIGTIGGGLARFDPRTGTIRRWPYRVPAGDETGEGRKVFALLRDPVSDRLYVATGAGLLEIAPDRAGRRWIPYDRGDGSPPGPQCAALSLDARRRLWVATWGEGLAVVDLSAPDAALRLRPAAEGSARRIVTVLADREGTVWIGSWDHGLQRLAGRAEEFAVLAVGEQRSGGRPVDVTALAAGRDGGLWAGGWGGGLFRRARGDDTFRPVPIAARFRSVLSILEDSRGHVWLGTMGGLLELDGQGRPVREHLHDPRRERSLGFGYVTALLEDHAGRIWAGVGGTGLHRLRANGIDWDAFRSDPDDPASPSDDYVTALLEDRRGRLWVGTRSGGLNLFDGTGFRRFVPDPRDHRSLPHHAVTSLLEDRRGRLWVGTDGGGLALVEESDDGRFAFRRYGAIDGLVDEQVVSIAEDRDGSLWIGTRHGLSRLAPERGAFSNAHAADGLPAEQFNPAAAATDGQRLYFGTSRGLLAIRAGTPFAPPAPAPVVVTGLTTPGETLELDAPPWSLDRLEVPWGRMISVAFSVLDFADERWHRYAYRFDEQHADWVPLGARHEVTFSDLDPGRYTLRLRGRRVYR